MRKLHIAAVVTLNLLWSGISFSQRDLDVGVFFGVSHYMGDLQRSQLEVTEMHQAEGAFMRYNFTNVFSLKAHFYRGMISGSDANYPTIESAWKRNLSFRSPVYEVGLIGELNFMNFGLRKKHYSKRLVGYLASTYLFSGISGFYFNPQTNFQGKWYDLQPLGTEGQGLNGRPPKYNRTQLAIPFGFGFKIRASKWSCLGFEVGFRKTFTDHLDDVSGAYPDLQELEEANVLAARLSYRSPEVDAQAVTNPEGAFRGNPGVKDMYFFAGLLLAITFSK